MRVPKKVICEFADMGDKPSLNRWDISNDMVSHFEGNYLRDTLDFIN